MAEALWLIRVARTVREARRLRGPERKGSYSVEGSCSTTISNGAFRATINSIGSVRLSLTG